MKLENYEVHLPSYSIGDHIYDKIGPVCESYGKTVLLIGGRRAVTVPTKPWKNCDSFPSITKPIWSLVWAVEKH